MYLSQKRKERKLKLTTHMHIHIYIPTRRLRSIDFQDDDHVGTPSNSDRAISMDLKGVMQSPKTKKTSKPLRDLSIDDEKASV